jgi:hypothetical protein
VSNYPGTMSHGRDSSGKICNPCGVYLVPTASHRMRGVNPPERSTSATSLAQVFAWCVAVASLCAEANADVAGTLFGSVRPVHRTRLE